MPVSVEAEDDAALQGGGRVVEVNDRPLGSVQRLIGAANEILAALGEHLDRDVLGNEVALNDLAHEVEVGLGRRGKAHLNLLEAHLHEVGKHDVLALEVHRVDQGLVAVAQVHAAPARGLGQSPVGPGAVRQLHGHRRAVLAQRPWGSAVGDLTSYSSFRLHCQRKTKMPPHHAGAGRAGLAPYSSSSLWMLVTTPLYLAVPRCPEPTAH